LGLSKTSHGRGVGEKRALKIFKDFSKSEAFSKGFIQSLAEAELFVDNIGPDIISDITANVVRKQLIQFTQQQCKKYGVEMEIVPHGPYWDIYSEEWRDDFFKLPVYRNPIILIPKRFAKIHTLYNPKEYYYEYILNYLQARHAPQESLGKALMTGKRRITKAELKSKYRYNKKFLYEFSQKNPNVFNHFKRDRSIIAKQEYRNYIHLGIDVVNSKYRRLMMEEVNCHQVNYVLHLSDLHLQNAAESNTYLTHLKLDLRRELNVKKLNFIVISGDIANEARKSEYDNSVKFIQDLADFSEINLDHIIVVPGNHDVDWTISRSAYELNEDNLENIREGKHIVKGSRNEKIDETIYKKRFDSFSSNFFEKIQGEPYPLEYSEQYHIREFPDERIVFLCLNSNWLLGHKYHKPSIEQSALNNAIDVFIENQYEGFLKIAVLHHPLLGNNSINKEFLQLLAVCGFKICMHGHVHESNNDLMRYDVKRSINVIGAGTFGAPYQQHVPGIPFQYNLITYAPRKKLLQVETRKKEKQLGPWCADARWGDKNSPVPQYFIRI